jgi:hypothetical protein
MAVVNVGKQMMLNLIIQTSGEVVAEQAIIAKVLSSPDLMSVKVFVRGMRALVCQVIDLGVDHEAEAQNDSRYCCKDYCFPKR